ncbi:hypothetical protein FCULG_00002742 [Fusarium culmorum]|uniref:NAD(P)-binding domain-containing protein n=1 Tax=Fusarium culmorum TaxID=5516 RepID=A0A2T4HBE2_FUSCU|nr:hypothetical protein FCULG_00002742 [Fusarium culmorum]
MSLPSVLVLGGTGPAGICLLRELLHRKHKVVAYARTPSKVPEDLATDPLLEIVKGELSDNQALATAVAKCGVVVSLLGPQLSDRSMDPSVFPKFYKSSLFPAMRQHGVKRVFAMGTLSIVRPEDSWSILRPTMVMFVRLLASGAYRTIIGIGETFENEAKDLDWTIFRIAGIPGESDNESWARDREDGKTFVGWIGEKGHTYSQKRAALSRWLVNAVEGGLQDWVLYQPGGSASALSSDRHQRRMAYIISDPHALRSAVLIAATHFGFNFGNIKSFEQTFYFHTLETVRSVKEWFAKGDYTLCAPITKQMALLAYTEACRGDHQMAEKHLNAIYALSRYREGHMATGGTILDQKLSDRYFLITSTFMHGTTTALEFLRRPIGFTETATSSASLTGTPSISSWHIADDRGQYFHSVALDAIREFPVTFNYSGDIFQDISVARVLPGLRVLTRNFYDGYSKTLPRSAYQIQHDFWQSEASAMLYEGFIEAHKSSVPKGNKAPANNIDEDKQKTSWVGLLIATELYLEQIVVLWRPFTRDNYLYTMRILQRDLSYALQKPNAPQLADLLFWESFIAVISLQVHKMQGDLAHDRGIKLYFEEFARERSRVLGLKTWKDVKAALLRVVWPCDFTDDDYVKGIWEAVVEYEAVQGLY